MDWVSYSITQFDWFQLILKKRHLFSEMIGIIVILHLQPLQQNLLQHKCVLSPDGRNGIPISRYFSVHLGGHHRQISQWWPQKVPHRGIQQQRSMCSFVISPPEPLDYVLSVDPEVAPRGSGLNTLLATSHLPTSWKMRVKPGARQQTKEQSGASSLWLSTVRKSPQCVTPPGALSMLIHK